MNVHVAALVLDEIATLLELAGAERFRVHAYRGAARALDKLEGELEMLYRSGELAEVRGLGPATLSVVRDLLHEGESRLHRRLREATPSGWVEMLGVPGLGPKKIRQLHEALGIDTLDELRAAAEAGRLATVPGFGERTQAKVLEGIRFVRGAAGRRRQPQAYEAADRFLGFLERLPGVVEARLAGELRRRLETVAGLDLLVVADDGDAAVAALDAFVALPGPARAERLDARHARSRLADALEVRVRAVPPPEAGAAWIHATGPAVHVQALRARADARGLRLDEDGVWRAGERLDAPDEAAVYDVLGLDWVPPELRDHDWAVERAARRALPRLVDTDDLRGTFHCHTTYSDGVSTLAELAEAALARGWRYLGIADHSQAASYAGGLTAVDVRRQHAEIDGWNARRGDALWLFKGIEADILADGALDYAGEAGVLESFDFVIGSVHARQKMPAAEMTARVLRALDDPRLTMLGHPTGRLLLTRDASALDVPAMLERAAERGVVVEINADPHRMDLDWRYWPAAKELGVRAAVNPDAHSARGLGAVAWGLAMARKGGLEPADVLNAWPLDELKAYLDERRERGG